MSNDRTAEEWGRVAVGLPGFRWMPGMAGYNADGPFRVDAVDGRVPCKVSICQWSGERQLLDIRCGPIPNPDDPATAGCLLELLCGAVEGFIRMEGGVMVTGKSDDGSRLCVGSGTNLGRACIAAAEKLGRWRRWDEDYPHTKEYPVAVISPGSGDPESVWYEPGCEHMMSIERAESLLDDLRSAIEQAKEKRDG